MKLDTQKRIAASVLKCSAKKVWFDQSRLEEIKEAITRRDIKGLINDGAIGIKPLNRASKARARKRKKQKAKGRRKGGGRRKGTFNARRKKKRDWMNNIRYQRAFLKELADKGIITKRAYQKLYLQAKSGVFRSKRHIKLFIAEHVKK